MKGFSSKDQQEWMNLIFEATSMSEHADELEKVVNWLNEGTYNMFSFKNINRHFMREHPSTESEK